MIHLFADCEWKLSGLLLGRSLNCFQLMDQKWQFVFEDLDNLSGSSRAWLHEDLKNLVLASSVWMTQWKSIGLTPKRFINQIPLEIYFCWKNILSKDAVNIARFFCYSKYKWHRKKSHEHLSLFDNYFLLALHQTCYFCLSWFSCLSIETI